METCHAENFEPLFALIPLLFTCFFLMLITVTSILCVIAFCKIFQKAGYSWAMGLLMLVPIVRFVAVLYLGFAKWPIEKKIEADSKTKS